MDAFLVESGVAFGDATYPMYDFIDWSQCGPNSLQETLDKRRPYEEPAADPEVIALDLDLREADVAGGRNEAVKASFSIPSVLHSNVAPALPKASDSTLVAPPIAVSVPAFPVLKRTRAYTFVQEDPSRPKRKRNRKVRTAATPERANKKARPAPTPNSPSSFSSHPSTVDPPNQVDPSVPLQVSRAIAERRLLKAFPKPAPNAPIPWYIFTYKEIEADLAMFGGARVRELHAIVANPARLALRRRQLHNVAPESDVEAYGPYQWTGGPPLDTPQEVELLLEAAVMD